MYMYHESMCIQQFSYFAHMQYSESQHDLFASHSVATEHLLPAIMSIFIDIEFTGESMEFEDKFRKLVCYIIICKPLV